MNNGYYQATGAMVTQFNRLDVITQNLANVNTIGYKRQDVVIADFERIFKETRDELPLDNHTKDAAKFLARSIDRVPNINDVYTDFSAGGLKTSTNALDVAIVREDAFLLVQTPAGETRLTKNGALTLDPDGYIVTKEGYRVLNTGYEALPDNARGIQVPNNVQIAITPNGDVYGDEVQLGRLYIAQPRDLRTLKQEGDNLYIPAYPEDVTDTENSGALRQGFVQMSNVNPVTQMVNLIETQRLVESYQKVMTTHMNDLNSEAITKLGSIRA